MPCFLLLENAKHIQPTDHRSIPRTTLLLSFRTEYVKERILALRRKEPGKYRNASVVRTNTMKHLVQYFPSGTLEKLFFLFPDPHFKAANYRRRIIQTTLLDEYAFLLKPGGVVYTITDVEDLGHWMRRHLEMHPLFEPVPEAELEGDAAATLLQVGTEEGQKVQRNGGKTWKAIFRKKRLPGAEKAAS
jgi:tRNA (guanine-N7-)-methyltransferase